MVILHNKIKKQL